MTCEKCKKLEATLDAIRNALNMETLTVHRGRQTRIVTEVGRVIAANASARGVRLSEVSRRAGFAADYVSRVCRGDLPLSRRAAMLIGTVIGVDLTGFVKDERAGKGETPAAEPLPFPLPGVGVAS